MSFRPEVIPFILAAIVFGVLIFALAARFSRLSLVRSAILGDCISIIFIAYFLFFFRDPTRTPPSDPSAILAAADGVVAKIVVMDEAAFGEAADFAGLKGSDLARFQGGPTIRISIFLSLFDVHVNRFPIAGSSRFLGYFPGKHLFTFDEKSSDVNQHNSILVTNEQTVCLINQIVGPVCRRVVYWLDHDEAVDVKAGADFGMMKFGSRLDMYFPEKDIALRIQEGDRVRAGESIIGTLK